MKMVVLVIVETYDAEEQRIIDKRVAKVCNNIEDAATWKNLIENNFPVGVGEYLYTAFLEGHEVVTE